MNPNINDLSLEERAEKIEQINLAHRIAAQLLAEQHRIDELRSLISGDEVLSNLDNPKNSKSEQLSLK